MDTQVTDASGEAMTINCQLMALSAGFLARAMPSHPRRRRWRHGEGQSGECTRLLSRRSAEPGARLNGSSFKDDMVDRFARTMGRRPGSWTDLEVESASVVSRASAKRSSNNKLQARRVALLHRSKGHDRVLSRDGNGKGRVGSDSLPSATAPSPVSLGGYRGG